MAAYAWLGAKSVTLRRGWKKLMNFVKDTTQKETEDNTTHVEGTLPALNTIPESGDCDNVDVMEWLQCDEYSSIGRDTNVVRASNNGSRYEYNGNDDAPRCFEVFEALETTTKTETHEERKFAELDPLKKLYNLF